MNRKLFQIRVNIIGIFILLIANCGFSQSCWERHNIMVALYKEGKISEAIIIGEEALPICEKEMGRKSNEYASMLKNIADFYNQKDNYSKAELLYIEALNIQKKVLGPLHPYYAVSLNNLAVSYINHGNYTKAEPLYLEAIEIQKKISGIDNIGYATSLDNLAVLYTNQANYAKAEPLFLEVLAIRKKVLGVSNIDFVTSLNNLAFLYGEEKNYSTAEPLYLKALEIEKKILGTENPEYATSLNNLALLYSYQNKYSKAEPLYLEALAIRKKTLGIEHPIYATTLNDLADLYNDNGNYASAEFFYLEALAIRKKVLGNENPDNATTLSHLATFYNNQGKYSKAEPLYLEALAIRKKILGIEHPDYASSLICVAVMYNDQGNYTKVEPLYLEALSIQKKILGIENPDYLASLNKLAGFYKQQGNFVKAESMFLETLGIQKRIFGTENRSYTTYLNNLASLYCRSNNNEKAEPLYLEALAIERRILGIRSPDYAILLGNMADMYFTQNKNEKSLPLYREAFIIQKNVLIPEHPDYNRAINNLAGVYKFLDNPEYLVCLKELLPVNQKQIIQQCSFQTTDELSKYLNKNRYAYFDNKFSLAYPFIPENDTIQSQLFNTAILLKNLTLRNSGQVQDKIRESKDTVLLSTLEHFQWVKRQLNKYAAVPKAEQPANIKDLENEAELLEKKLVLGSQVFKDANEFTNTTWIKVQQSLKKDEAAIEFVSFRYYNKKWTDSTLYAAMVIRPGYAYPKIISLFEQKQLDSLLKRDSGTIDSNYISQVYGNDNYALYKLIVKPLDSLLQGVTTIYAAPSGLLHSINLPLIMANKPDGSRFNLHLVGTTGELPQYTSLHLNKNTIKNAYIFGGIDYEKASNTSISFKSSNYTPGFEQMASVFIRGGTYSWGYLPGTLTEATQIEKLNNNAGVKATVMSGTDASETNFKNLNGVAAPFVLHIATHGYFFGDAVKEKPTDFNSLNSDKKTIFKWADDPLLRSGLILAGANKAWKNNTPANDSTEDGVLTSMEVANIDLSNCKLAVLSACETGLGTINGSEGVFGLQRGFKLAGVKNIIMSLWKIPDNQSAELLTLFYQNCFSGLTVHESLKQAQLAMSKKYPAFYWAGFVLLE